MIEIAKEAGCLSRYIAVPFYCINLDITKLILNWKVLPEFAEYINICALLTNEENASTRIDEYEIEFMKQSQRVFKMDLSLTYCVDR